MSRAKFELQSMWARHSAAWRDAAQVSSQCADAAAVDPALLRWRTRGHWWETLDSLSITLFVTREYEHLVMALCADRGIPRLTYFPLPHPSGLAVDRANRQLFIASTRNPNQVIVLRPVRGMLARGDVQALSCAEGVMATVYSRSYRGSLYR